MGAYEYTFGQRVAKTSAYRGRLHANIDQGNKPAANQGNGKGNTSQSNVHATTDNAPVTEHLQFVYDEHGNLISESDGEGHVVREYIYLGNIRIAMTTSTLEYPEVTPAGLGAAQGPKPGTLALYFIHNDHLGTPKVVTDGSQNIVWSLHQTPFGETTLDTEAIRMPMRFPGQYADIESGYSYNYFRDYDPTLGRYVESDPIGLQGGDNAFAYALLQPASNVDRLGKCPNCVTAILGGILGAASAVYGTYLENPQATPEEYLLNGSVGLLTGVLAGAGFVEASPLAGAIVGFFANAFAQVADIASHPCKSFATDFNLGSLAGATFGGFLAGRLVAPEGILALATAPKAALVSTALTVVGARAGE